VSHLRRDISLTRLAIGRALRSCCASSCAGVDGVAGVDLAGVEVVHASGAAQAPFSVVGDVVKANPGQVISVIYAQSRGDSRRSQETVEDESFCC